MNHQKISTKVKRNIFSISDWMLIHRKSTNENGTKNCTSKIYVSFLYNFFSWVHFVHSIFWVSILRKILREFVFILTHSNVLLHSAFELSALGFVCFGGRGTTTTKKEEKKQQDQQQRTTRSVTLEREKSINLRDSKRFKHSHLPHSLPVVCAMQRCKLLLIRFIFGLR